VCHAAQENRARTNGVSIKTRDSVSCGPRKQGVHKRSEYIDKVTILTHP